MVRSGQMEILRNYLPMLLLARYEANHPKLWKSCVRSVNQSQNISCVLAAQKSNRRSSESIRGHKARDPLDLEVAMTITLPSSGKE